VLFDSSGDPYPELGHQRQPKPGVRNSVWVQSPGAKGLIDPKQVEDALNYAEDVVAVFAVDKRVLAWDVWNEPDNTNASSYPNSELPNKVEVGPRLAAQSISVRARRRAGATGDQRLVEGRLVERRQPQPH